MGLTIEHRLAKAERFKFEFVTVGPWRHERFYYPRGKYHLLRKKIKWFFEEGRNHYVDAERPILSIKLPEPEREGYIKITPCVWSHHNLPLTLPKEKSKEAGRAKGRR